MISNSRSNLIPILQALFVTFLWSTSFVVIKWGLADIPPIIFAGLRYVIAFLCFLPFILKRRYIDEIKSLSINQWIKLILLGIIFYTFTQGAQFLGLSLLPSVTVSLMLNFTPLLVAAMAIFLINEKPSLRQWFGALVFLSGIIIYFSPLSSITGKTLGLIIMSIGVLANSISAILGRSINRNKDISPMIVTFISMGIGSVLLLSIGIIESGLPKLSLNSWLYILWLAVVSTAFAFTLWNKTLQSLTAMESSIINGTMLIQIAILAWVFLGESITVQEGIGMILAAIGAVIVQLKNQRRAVPSK